VVWGEEEQTNLAVDLRAMDVCEMRGRQVRSTSPKDPTYAGQLLLHNLDAASKVSLCRAEAEEEAPSRFDSIFVSACSWDETYLHFPVSLLSDSCQRTNFSNFRMPRVSLFRNQHLHLTSETPALAAVFSSLSLGQIPHVT
jgi:hypothetical protein